MQERCKHILNGSVQRPRTDVQFAVSFSLDAPCVVQGIMPIRTGGGLYGDDRTFQRILKKVCDGSYIVTLVGGICKGFSFYAMVKRREVVCLVNAL